MKQKRNFDSSSLWHRFGGSAGFTLIELVVVIVVMGIIGGLSLGFLGNWTGLYTKLLAQKRADGEVYDSVESMRRELRSLRSVSIGTQTGLVFVNARTATVTMAKSGGRIVLNDNTLAKGVARFDLKYFSGGNVELPAPLSAGDREQVARVQLDLRITNGPTSAETIVNFHLLEGFLK